MYIEIIFVQYHLSDLDVLRFTDFLLFSVIDQVRNQSLRQAQARYRRWRNESYRYSGSDKYPWPQPVLYHICIEMRRTGVERQMTEGELKRLAEKLLTKWSKHVGNGLSVPPIRRQLAAPHHPAGPTPAQILMEEYKRRKAAGLIN
ncbi:replication protein P [Citrobacter braakii]|uniref:replication protein P n=1 Tax=Citrobacter braakii TaxID=57706 RepID=UPI00378E5F7F